MQINRDIRLPIGGIAISLESRENQERELFSAQFKYGHREILLDYMALPRTTLLKGILQHGVIQNGIMDRNSYVKDLKTPRIGLFKRSPLWVYATQTENYLLNEKVRNVKAIGAPWLYLLKNLNLEPDILQNKERPTRYLAFPTHFDMNDSFHYDKTKIREKITAWKSLAGNAELTLCLFWTEYLTEEWQEVAGEEGVTVVTAGLGRTDPSWSQNLMRTNFLHKLLNILDSASHCIFEDLSSAIFYALSLGLKVGYFPITANHLIINDKKTRLQSEGVLSFSQNWIGGNMSSIIDSFDSSPELRSIANLMLGKDALREQEELKEILVFNIHGVPAPAFI